MSSNFRLGVFVIAMMLIFAGGVFWIGSKQFLFTSTYHLNADFQNVAGLSNGADVRVGGIHQGTVKRIDLLRRPDEKLRVLMDLKRATRDVIKKDSVAAIRSEGLVGDKYVEISFGSNEAPKVNNGDTIGSEPSVEMSDLIKKTNVILDSAKGAMQNVGDTTEQLKSISSKINKGSGTAGALVNDKSLYEHLNAGVTALHEDMEALKHNFLLRGFFKKRGYEDSTDLTKNAISQLPSKPYVKKFTYSANKIFDKENTAKLKSGKALNEAGEILQNNPFGPAGGARVTGIEGGTPKEPVLATARANAVPEYLLQQLQM